MKCYLLSEPNKRVFRKRMHNVWKDIGVFELPEQKLAGQILAIKRNDRLSHTEIEEIKREIESPDIHGKSNDEDDIRGTQNYQQHETGKGERIDCEKTRVIRRMRENK